MLRVPGCRMRHSAPLGLFENKNMENRWEMEKIPTEPLLKRKRSQTRQRRPDHTLCHCAFLRTIPHANDAVHLGDAYIICGQAFTLIQASPCVSVTPCVAGSSAHPLRLPDPGFPERSDRLFTRIGHCP